MTKKPKPAKAKHKPPPKAKDKSALPIGTDPTKTFPSHPFAKSHPFEPMGRKR